MFTSDEIIHIESAIETYNESSQNVIRPALQKELSKSVLSKLSTYSPFTRFTKQEYTLMGLAVMFMIGIVSMFPDTEELANELSLIFDKLSLLADPNGS